jgi:hypothetical protein
MPPARVASPFCLSGLICWFYGPALLRLAAQLVRVALAGLLWPDLWTAGLRPPERIFLDFPLCPGLAGLSPSRWEFVRDYSRLDKRMPFAHARQELGPFVHVEIVVDFFQFDQQLDDVRIVGINLRRIQRAQQ